MIGSMVCSWSEKLPGIVRSFLAAVNFCCNCEVQFSETLKTCMSWGKIGDLPVMWEIESCKIQLFLIRTPLQELRIHYVHNAENCHIMKRNVGIFFET